MSSQRCHRVDYDTAIVCKNCKKNTYVEYLCYPLCSEPIDAYHKYCPKCMINSQIQCPGCDNIRKSEDNKCAMTFGIIFIIIFIIIVLMNPHYITHT